ncbi:MAG: hypothetical protein KIT36_23185 [Alphaproteobacteria bacterium]|nr:hypothetical protein [Alphaproteobacteria bacterium]
MNAKPYVIDMVDVHSKGGAYFKEMVQKYGGPPKFNAKVVDLVGGFCRTGYNAILDMMDKAIAAAEGQYGSIRCLAVWGHGLVDSDHNPIGVHALTGGWSGVDDGYALTVSWLNELGSSMERLRGYFDTSGRFEIRGCGAAVGQGLEVMKILAARWQVEVHASAANSMGMAWAAPVKAVTADGSVRIIDGIEYDRR